MYRDLYPESGDLLRRNYILLPINKNLLSRDEQEALLQLERDLAPGIPAAESPMARTLEAADMELFGKVRACILKPGHAECGFLTISSTLPPEKMWFHLEPFKKQTEQ